MFLIKNLLHKAFPWLFNVGTYEIRTKNGKSLYIGKTGNISRRKNQHMKKAKHGRYTYKMFNPDKHDFVITSFTNTKEEEAKQIRQRRPKRNKRSYTYSKPKTELSSIKKVFAEVLFKPLKNQALKEIKSLLKESNDHKNN